MTASAPGLAEPFAGAPGRPRCEHRVHLVDRQTDHLVGRLPGHLDCRRGAESKLSRLDDLRARLSRARLEVFRTADRPGFHQEDLRARYQARTGVVLDNAPRPKATLALVRGEGRDSTPA